MPLLSETAHYDSIRRLIDITLPAVALPDGVIADPVFQGRAEQVVLARFPDAEDYTGAELAAATTAALYLTAALLVPAIPVIVSEQFADQSRLQLKPPEISARVAQLRASADELLDGLRASDDADEDVTNFAIVTPCRTDDFF